MKELKDKNIHSRGYIPHIEGADYQFVTYRLFDSLPKKVLLDVMYFDAEKQFKYLNHYLNQGLGSCLLRFKKNAEIVIKGWQHFDALRYKVVAYVVMPNHVHILIKVLKNFKLSEIVHSWKSFTAKKIKTDEVDKVWFREYFDRYIRDEDHFNRVIDYIKQNPVKAGLV